MTFPRASGDRRALSHVGGAITESGDRQLTALLGAAVAVPTSIEAEDLARAHVHGFHSYPARMHPLTATRLIAELSREGAWVLDPFCGSGTVLVEARILGRRAAGVDANPLAARLATLKVTPWSTAELRDLAAMAEAAAEVADERRKAKRGPSERYPQADVALFEPHVLLELDGIRAGIEGLPAGKLQDALLLVLSAILIKLSRRASDTSNRSAERRVGAGYPARLFTRKTTELVRRLEEVQSSLPETQLGGSPPYRVIEGDARDLRSFAPRSVDLVVSSPPYPGNYDYLEHHAARLRWLRLRAERFDRAEIGARRHLDPLGPEQGAQRWRSEMASVLRGLRRVLRPGGPLVFLLADSVVAGAPLYAVDELTRLARDTAFRVAGTVSQPRPNFHGPSARAFERRPRQEHAIVLVSDDARG